MNRPTQSELIKILHLLKKYYEEDRERKIFSEVINYSDFVFRDHWNMHVFETLFNLDIYLDHEVFLKHIESKGSIRDLIKFDLQNISRLRIDEINMYPDYEKLEVIDNKIRPVYTIWDQINIGQHKLISQLEKGNSDLDLRNIGNSARIVLQKLANLVFDPTVHSPNDPLIDVSESKFKNRLHSYIKIELEGSENKELRKFAESAIQTVEDSIDLANSLTHKLDPRRTIAEVCVIGTISTISIIKLIKSKEQK